MDDQWIVWCGTNDEQDSMAEALGEDCVSVYGTLSPDEKVDRVMRWQQGEVRILVTKPSVLGWGMNFQNCARMIFVGLSDSYEQYFQAIRRCWRYGQTREVKAYIVLTDVEEPIYRNVLRKEKEARVIADELIKHVANFERAEIGEARGGEFVYETKEAQGENWRLLLGDSVERLKEIESESVHLSVMSPPFNQLYVYSASERDLGNSKSSEEFFKHFQFIIQELLRVTLPGRVCAIHVADIPAMLVRDGYIGMKDFSGDVVRAFIEAGWVYDGRVPLDKNQQAQAIRTHAKALVKSQLEKDSSWLRPALPDYILKFRKPGENPIPVSPIANGEMTMDTWIEWAAPTWPSEDDGCADGGAFPTWYGIKESDTLNVAAARSADDSRHICPLQLGTIERCIRLWSNPGETVLDPFNGIGSTGFQAVAFGRRYLGIELKELYFEQAVRNLRNAEQQSKREDLFDYAARAQAEAEGEAVS